MRRREFSTLFAGVAAASTAWPFAARLQQKATPVIGVINVGTPGTFAPVVAAFRQGLSETGYVEGQIWRSNTAGRRIALIGCPHWLPTLSAARLM
jgi:hypothetical protein